MTAPLQPGLRERQRLQTHQLIRCTAYDLALEHGAAAVSVQAICEAAGVSSRTFFNHFRSKEEALVPDLPGFTSEAEESFVSGSEPDLVTALEVLIGEHLARISEQFTDIEGPVAMQRLLQANPGLLPRALAVFEHLEQRVTALVARRTGRSPDDLDCTVAALAATSAVRAAFAALPEDGRCTADRLRELVPAAFDVLRRLASGGPPAAGRP